MADLDDALAALAEGSIHDLQIEWRRHYRRPPPARLSRDLLRRGIAYKLQAQAQHGLSQAAKRVLRGLVQRLDSNGAGSLDPGRSLKPGARLVRVWHGRSHVVTVLDDGFDYAGQRFASLTAIATHITGVKWSGPRFFGLTRSGASSRPGKPAEALDEAA